MQNLKNIISFRHALHQNPETSNNEYLTSKRVSEFINAFSPDEVIKISKTGKAFIYHGIENGPTLLFRAELDALLIMESSNVSYSSVNTGIAHSCGHDGHMAIIAGLVQKISQNRPEKGRVVLLFQPAEEIEQGARDVVEDPEFQKIEPDYIFGLHNIPGYEKHKVLLKKGNFAAASKGMTIELLGKTSHAGEPENGINPVIAIEKIIRELTTLASQKELFKDLVLLTFIYIRLGEISFGTTPGKAEIMITLRSFENKDMNLLIRKSEKIIKEISQEEKLKYEISYNEIFPATINNGECIDLLEQAVIHNNYNFKYLKNPFKWSEDFAYYSAKYKSGFFGLGAGINQPKLHNPDYDFPDEIIETGINIFYDIYKQINF